MGLHDAGVAGNFTNTVAYMAYYIGHGKYRFLAVWKNFYPKS